ncbi:hypothetical protein FRC08_011873 [Ceratobasidium sp. 394]|nr:hypothetical protein FRC08_011873 [Ceratobasidium sp. 394]
MQLPPRRRSRVRRCAQVSGSIVWVRALFARYTWHRPDPASFPLGNPARRVQVLHKVSVVACSWCQRSRAWRGSAHVAHVSNNPIIAKPTILFLSEETIRKVYLAAVECTD